LKKLKVLSFTNTEVAVRVWLILGMELLFMAVWMIVQAKTGPASLRHFDANGTVFTWKCERNPLGIGLLVAFNGCLILWGCYIGWRMKDVALRNFNESKHIAICIWNLSFVAIIVVPLLFSMKDLDSEYLLRSGAVFFVVLVTLLIFLGNRVYLILSGIDGTRSSNVAGGSVTGGSIHFSKNGSTHESALDDRDERIEKLEGINKLLEAKVATLEAQLNEYVQKDKMSIDMSLSGTPMKRTVDFSSGRTQDIQLTSLSSRSGTSGEMESEGKEAGMKPDEEQNLDDQMSVQ